MWRDTLWLDEPKANSTRPGLLIMLLVIAAAFGLAMTLSELGNAHKTNVAFVKKCVFCKQLFAK